MESQTRCARVLGLKVYHSACYPVAGIARRLAFEVVRLCVQDDTLADGAIGRGAHIDALDVKGRGNLARAARLDIAEIARMSFGSIPIAMRFAGWIEMAARARTIGSAAIAFFVHMQSVHAAGLELR